MKKSNKLLLAGFLVFVLSVAASQIILYANYKSGNYSIYRVESDPEFEVIEAFAGVKNVKIENLSTASVVLSDAALVKEDYKHLIELIRNGETMLIRGKVRINWDDSSDQVLLHLPVTIPISMQNSTIIFRGGKMEQGRNASFDLQQANAIFSGDRVPLALDNLKIIASQNSNASINANATINKTEVQLSNSSIAVNGANPGDITIVTDSLSRISLPYRILTTAKITTHPGD